MLRRLLPVLFLSSASPLAAQGGWQLTITPFAGRAHLGTLMDYAADTTISGVTQTGTFVTGTDRVLSLAPARARGLRLEMRAPSGWSFFGETSHGKTTFEYRSSSWTRAEGEVVASRELMRQDQARVTTATVGVGRSAFGAGSRRAELALGAGATVQHFGLERKPGAFCFVGETSCDPEASEGWESSYTAPGASLALALRVHVARGWGVEARTSATLVRAGTGEIADTWVNGSDPEDAGARWVRSTHLTVGVFNRIAVAPREAGAGLAGRLTLTPYAGVARPGKLLDRRGGGRRDVERFRGGGVVDTVPMVSTSVRELSLESAPTLGLRAAYQAFGAWTLFADGSFARTRYQHIDSVWYTVEGERTRSFRTYGHDRDRASVLAVALGVEREVALRSTPLALTVGVGAAAQRVELERLELQCSGGPSIYPCPRADPWESSYTVPGAVGTLALRWDVARRVALEARSALTVGRVRNGGIEASAHEANAVSSGDPDVPSAQWMRGAQITLGVALHR